MPTTPCGSCGEGSVLKVMGADFIYQVWGPMSTSIVDGRRQAALALEVWVIGCAAVAKLRDMHPSRR